MSIFDEGYKVNKRKYFTKKKKAKDGSGNPGRKIQKKKKKYDKDGNEIKVKKRKNIVDQSITELTGGLYTTCNSNSKKVCGQIVAPLELLKNTDEGSQSSTNTDELVQVLLEQESLKLEKKRKKHKERKHKEHCKKHKKSECCLFFLCFVDLVVV